MGGGLGEDTVSYQGAQAPVSADLDGADGDDGAAGEKDEIGADVENLVGSLFGDTLVGNVRSNSIRGGGGNDLIEGLAGNDQLFGEAGEDTLLSTDGAADDVNCGVGTDSADADADDALVGCERNQAQGGGQTGDGQDGGAGQTGGSGRSRPGIGPARVRLTSRGVARLRVTCPADVAQSCRGRLTLRRKLAGRVRMIGSRRFRVAAGRRAVVRIRVSELLLRRLTHSGMRVRVTARTPEPADRIVRILPQPRSGRSG
jgi:RTX calcium-binding nonapeptide repeat (4 copies)